MRKNFSEILSLEDTESYKSVRSKSSEHFINTTFKQNTHTHLNPNINANANDTPILNKYKLVGNTSPTAGTSSSPGPGFLNHNNSRDENYNYNYNYNYSHSYNTQTEDILGDESEGPSHYGNGNIGTGNKKTKKLNLNKPQNKPQNNLHYDYNIINADNNKPPHVQALEKKLEDCEKKEKKWRLLYFNLLNDSICFEETIKNLLEENRIHQEYIISLEVKLNKLLVTCNNITTNFHNSIRSMSMQNMSNMNINVNNGDNSVSSHNSDNISTRENNYNPVNIGYPEILNDYKKQLEILADEKEALTTNLSISRHQQLQTSMKLEDVQTRLFNLEQIRLDEMRRIGSKLNDIKAEC